MAGIQKISNFQFQIHVRIQFSESNFEEKLEKGFAGNRLAEAVKFGEKWMKKCRFKFEELNVELVRIQKASECFWRLLKAPEGF